MQKYIIQVFTKDVVSKPRQVLARPTWVTDRGRRCAGRSKSMAWKKFWSRLPSGQWRFLVCSVWPIPTFWYVKSGLYTCFGSGIYPVQSPQKIKNNFIVANPSVALNIS